MARLKQMINTKKKATRKNNKAKYTYTTNRKTSYSLKNNKVVKKYSYTRKVYRNGKYIYYYT